MGGGFEKRGGHNYINRGAGPHGSGPLTMNFCE